MNICPTDNPNTADVLADDVLTTALHQLIQGNDLSAKLMGDVMRLIMMGNCPDVLLSALMVALKIKGESVDEIVACAKVMKQFAHSITVAGEHLVDIVGTGGDGANLFNISTAAAFVMACAGATVVKHGSTGVSTKNGSSDLLAYANVALLSHADDINTLIQQEKMAFLFAPNHHPAMKFAKNVRSVLKTRTIFNILGPLTNPAHIANALLGAYSRTLCHQMSQAMAQLGGGRVLVVHSDDGLDEISLAAPTFVSQLDNGKLSTYTITPEDFGIASRSLEGLQVTNAAQSHAMICHALQGTTDDPIIQKAQDIIALNAGAGLYAAGVVHCLHAGITLAKQILTYDHAYQKLKRYAALSMQLNNVSS